ncbi:hypothetical protein GJ496_001323 [Pomphorhynchus laevis]|nr:hypothetical protein GJ496_001323 [Pomphorhynchus laevis]
MSNDDKEGYYTQHNCNEDCLFNDYEYEKEEYYKRGSHHSSIVIPNSEYVLVEHFNGTHKYHVIFWKKRKFRLQPIDEISKENLKAEDDNDDQRRALMATTELNATAYRNNTKIETNSSNYSSPTININCTSSEQLEISCIRFSIPNSTEPASVYTNMIPYEELLQNMIRCISYNLTERWAALGRSNSISNKYSFSNSIFVFFVYTLLYTLVGCMIL